MRVFFAMAAGLLVLCVLGGCAGSWAEFDVIRQAPHSLEARSVEGVEILTSNPASRPYVVVGTVRAGSSTPEKALMKLHEEAAKYGCDALVMHAPEATVEKGDCIVYSDTK